MKKYFDHLTGADQVNNEFKKLAIEHHPDKRGDTATMQEINKQRSAALRRISIAEGKAPSYYEDLLEKGASMENIIEFAHKIDKDLSAEGNEEGDFKALFGAVSEKLFGKKVELPKNMEDIGKLLGSGGSSKTPAKKKRKR